MTTRHTHARADLLADIDNLGGVEGISLIAGMLPGGVNGGVARLLSIGVRALKAGKVTIAISTCDPEVGDVEIEIV